MARHVRPARCAAEQVCEVLALRGAVARPVPPLREGFCRIRALTELSTIPLYTTSRRVLNALASTKTASLSAAAASSFRSRRLPEPEHEPEPEPEPEQEPELV